MLPPPGFEPTSTPPFLDNAAPTSMVTSAIATATSALLVDLVDFTSTSSSMSAAATSAGADIYSAPDNGECQLLGPFAILVQGSLGLLALLALVYKRWRERPQRPMKIWFFDVSKQVVGSVLVHIANLLMSMLSSGQFSIKLDAGSVVARTVDDSGKYKPNPCSFYLLNLAIDTTIGIPILIFLLRILTALFAMTPVGNPPESIQSGHYGHPPKAFWWFKQSIIYFIGLLGMKICVLIIFLVLPWISRIGDWALRWTEGDEVLQVIFVMLIFPVIMNATQYYIIDSFIKNQNTEHERIPDDDSNASFIEGRPGRYSDPSGSSDEIHSGEEEEDDEVLAKVKAKSSTTPKKRSGLKSGSKDYDPLYDGESSPTVVGSTSSRPNGDSDDDGRH
ncbi:Vacuolar membrane protein [Rutstroemia sp. NJR-2017a WRK4]|nr:Vacuolar membrane protein [Rutstroemia sp. NJR-2017a WRK4]